MSFPNYLVHAPLSSLDPPGSLDFAVSLDLAKLRFGLPYPTIGLLQVVTLDLIIAEAARLLVPLETHLVH